MINQILEAIQNKYGHLGFSEMKSAMRKDGLGDIVDLLENPELINSLDEQMNEEEKLEEDALTPSLDIPSIPLSANDNFKFDSKACLAKCAGNCCKRKNYLMVNLFDIHRILPSKAAKLLNICSTRDLFEGKPPLLELLCWEGPKMYFPYIRFLPIGADLETKPEYAEDSICPFLRPISEVYAFHKEDLPEWAREEAMGCILREDKPSVCRLSPIGESRRTPGKVTFEYTPPIFDCPACETDVEIKVSDYISSVIPLSEKKQKERAHQILIDYSGREGGQVDQARCYEILKQVHNIDGLLFQYGLGIENRPQIDKLLELVIAATKGHFSVYEEFIQNLKNATTSRLYRSRS
jgi:hypothetical protein